jgi:hypothetical protein
MQITDASKMKEKSGFINLKNTQTCINFPNKWKLDSNEPKDGKNKEEKEKIHLVVMLKVYLYILRAWKQMQGKGLRYHPYNLGMFDSIH